MVIIFMFILLFNSYSIGTITDQISAGKVSAENVQLVEEIKEKIGINRKFKLAQPIDGLIESQPKFSSLYFCPGLNTLFINEKWLLNLSKNEKNFALATQIYRIGSYQPEMRLALRTLLVIMPSLLVMKVIDNKITTNLNGIIRSLIKIVSIIGTSWSSDKISNHFVLPGVSNFFAKRADAQANLILNSRKSGISFLKRIINETENEQRKQKLIDRLEYLKNQEI